MRGCIRPVLFSLALAGIQYSASNAEASCPNFRPPLVPTVEEARTAPYQLCAGTPYEARVEALKTATPEADALREAEAGRCQLLASSTPFSWEGHICTVPYEAEHTVDCALSQVLKPQQADRDAYLKAFSERIDPDPAADRPPVQCPTVFGALLADYTGRYNRAIVEHPRYPNRDLCVSRLPGTDGRRVDATAVPDRSTRPSRYASLAEAARFGDVPAVKASLAAGAGLEATDEFQLTALEWSVIRRLGEVQTALIEADSDRRQDYCQALRYAVGLGRKDQIAFLAAPCAKQPGAIAANDRNAAINRAAERGDLAMLRALHAAGFALFDEVPVGLGKSAAASQLREPASDWIDAILSEPPSVLLINESIGAHAPAEAACPLHAAAGKGNLEIARHLLALPVGADLPCKHANGYQPARALHWAIRGGHVEMVDLLLQSGASATIPDARHGPPLHFAIKAKFHIRLSQMNPNAVAALLKHGAAIDDLDQKGLPVLFEAARPFYVPPDRAPRDSLGILLSLGADPNVRSAEPDADLGSKAQPDRTVRFAQLLKALDEAALGSTQHPNRFLGLPASTHRTVLMHVIASSPLVAPGWTHYPPLPSPPDAKIPAGASLWCLEQVKALLAAGAYPNLADSLGLTALHYAARTDYGAAVAEVLIAAGARVNAKDRDGLTPLDHAVVLGLERMPAFLASKGARRGTESP